MRISITVKVGGDVLAIMVDGERANEELRRGYEVLSLDEQAAIGERIERSSKTNQTFGTALARSLSRELYKQNAKGEVCITLKCVKST